MPDEYGRSYNEYGQRYVGSVRRNSAAGTEGYWSTDSGRGPNWGLIFALLYGMYKILRYTCRLIARWLDKSNNGVNGFVHYADKANGAICKDRSNQAVANNANPDLHSKRLSSAPRIQGMDAASLARLHDKTPLEIARQYGFLYERKNTGAMLVDYQAFKHAVKAYVSSNNDAFLSNMHIYGPLLGASVERLNAEIRPIKGAELLDLIKSPEAKKMSKQQLAIAAGYNCVGSDWRERIYYKRFYEEILKAKGLAVQLQADCVSLTSQSNSALIESAGEHELDQLLRHAEKSVSRIQDPMR